MKKIGYYILVLLVLLSSCSSTKSFFAGDVGGIYLTTDDFSSEFATAEVNNDYDELELALWVRKSGSRTPSVSGHKVLFYSELDEKGFYNELVPDDFRATSLDDAGFIIVAEEGSPVFYNYYGNNGTLKVYYGTGVLKLYSIKTGKLLYTGSSVNGPTPPETVSVYSGTTSLTWDTPDPKSFKSQISKICSNISSGKISGSIPDSTAMEAAGASVAKSDNSKLSIQGVWTASSYNETSKLIFTDEGFVIIEMWNQGEFISAEIIDYTFTDSVLTIDGEEVGFDYTNKRLTLDIFPSDLQFEQKSKKATNKAGASALLGVWEGGNTYCSYIVGFTKDNFVIYQGSGQDFGSYNVNSDFVSFNYTDNEFYIIDNVLYLVDDGFFGEYEILRFEHATYGGVDSTSKTKLTNSGEITYASEDGESGNIFRFFSDGSFTDIPYSLDTTYPQVGGKYTYSNHIIKLSDGRELSIACIDDYYIGSSI